MMNKVHKLTPVPLPPPWPGGNRNYLGGGPQGIQPLQLIRTFSDEQFKIFVLQWVHEYLSPLYVEVQDRDGAGDKGRDIVAYIDPVGANPRRLDIYQCKHYQSPLSPSSFWVEAGKLIYFTYIGEYFVPSSYFIVASSGVGSTLQDFIDAPDKFRTELIKQWPSKCERKVSEVTRVPLDDDLLAYIQQFDFSIIKSLKPHELISQHAQTRYHRYVFGTPPLKPRARPCQPPSQIAPSEVKYVHHLYDAFADHLKSPVKDVTCFEHKRNLSSIFQLARVCFYFVETLKEFSRDNMLDDSPYEDLLDQFLVGLTSTINGEHSDGFARLIKTHEMATGLQINANDLKDELRPDDRIGICHHLANNDRLSWVI